MEEGVEELVPRARPPPIRGSGSDAVGPRFLSVGWGAMSMAGGGATAARTAAHNTRRDRTRASRSPPPAVHAHDAGGPNDGYIMQVQTPVRPETWPSIPMRCLDGLALTFIHARPLPSAQADLILRGARPNEEGEERQLPPLRSIIIIVVVVGFAASAASASRPAAACGSACGSGTGRCGHRWRPPCSSPGL